MIRAAGLIPRVYVSPDRFLEEIESQSPACILLDITMPSIDGYETARRLRVGAVVTDVSAQLGKRHEYLARIRDDIAETRIPQLCRVPHQRG